MTFKEKLIAEHPEFTKEQIYDMVHNQCPSDFGFTNSDEDDIICKDLCCEDHWDEEMPETTNTQNTKVQQHLQIVTDLNKLYERKNHDYGDSFGKSYAEDGLVMAKIRIGDKYNRFKTLIKSDAQVNDESIEDTLLDMANYAIMTVIELRNQKEKE